MKTKHRDKDRTRDYAKVWLFFIFIGLYLELMLLRTILTYGMETSFIYSIISTYFGNIIYSTCA